MSNQFAALPPELTAGILALLPVAALGRIRRVAKLFTSEPSPVEQALRRRAPAGTSPPPVGMMAIEWLFWLERRRLLTAQLRDRCSAGSSHYAVATADGALLTWGEGYEDEQIDRDQDAVGLLGLGAAVLEAEKPTRCELPEPHMRVRAVSCGTEHTLALCEGGEMLSWGCGSLGRLGHGNERRLCKPRRIRSQVGMQAVAAGNCHSIALSAGGRLYSWGAHRYSGHPNPPYDDEEPMWLRPAAVPSAALRGVRLVAAAASLCHTLLLASDGRVLSFGTGAGGRLGHGSDNAASGPEDCDTPRLISALQEVVVVQVAVGHSSSFAVDADGIVYRWGWLPMSQPPPDAMTLGETAHALLLPQRVELGARAHAISAGGYLCVAVSEEGRCLWWDNDAPHDEDQNVVGVEDRVVAVAAPEDVGCDTLAVDAAGNLHLVDLGGVAYLTIEGVNLLH